MSDLVKRLRLDGLPNSIKEEAADRIEALEAALDRVARVDNSLAKQLSQSMAVNAEKTARIEVLEAALRRAYGFLQDKAFTPDELTHECTKVLEVMEAALAPEQDK